MSQTRNDKECTSHPRTGQLRTISAVAVLGALSLFGTQTARADAVDDLAQSLVMRWGETTTLDPDVRDKILAHREASIQKRVDALKTIGELRRALSLQEWSDDPGRNLYEPLRKIDAKLRQQVGTRLTEAIRKVVDTGDDKTKLAVANLIAEMGPDVRAIQFDEKLKAEARKGFARTLTPEVLKLAADDDPGVRQEALRALGTIFPPEKEAVLVFKKALEKDVLKPRLLAAQSLSQLVRVVNHLQRKTRSTSGVEATQEELLNTVAEVVPASAAGMKDSDAGVRDACLQAVLVSAQAIADLIPDAAKWTDYPRQGRAFFEDDKKKILADQSGVLLEIKRIEPQLQAFQGQAPIFAHALADPDPLVRLAALNTLENVGLIRLRLKRRVQSIPTVKGEDDKETDGGIGAALKASDPFADFLKRDFILVVDLLNDRDVPVRRAAVDFLEILESAATPALPQLANSLSDPDRFVRWSAARALGNINPDKAEAALPGLAKLLGETDLNLRVAAATTLRLMGARAAPAVPALAQALANGDVEGREEAMTALQAIGPEAGKAAVPQLIEAMAHPDPRVRRGAAKTLGSFGRVAGQAVPALRSALGDDDQEVRINASDAILSILDPPAKKL